MLIDYTEYLVFLLVSEFVILIKEFIPVITFTDIYDIYMEYINSWYIYSYITRMIIRIVYGNCSICMY